MEVLLSNKRKYYEADIETAVNACFEYSHEKKQLAGTLSSVSHQIPLKWDLYRSEFIFQKMRLISIF